jgi:hypothetical protein
MNSVKAGGSIAPGAKISQSCSQTLGIQGDTIPKHTDGLNLAAQINQVGNKIGVTSNLTSAQQMQTVSINGTTYYTSDFIFPPGQSNFIDSYFPTPTAQQTGIIGGIIFCIICCVCCCCLFVMLKPESSASILKGMTASLGASFQSLSRSKF